uniref:Uncharacterized protein n=1 Tax=Oryza rufipogon TaxID=4529 RepID=A0A0E0NJR1_ORYRU
QRSIPTVLPLSGQPPTRTHPYRDLLPIPRRFSPSPDRAPRSHGLTSPPPPPPKSTPPNPATPASLISSAVAADLHYCPSPDLHAATNLRPRRPRRSHPRSTGAATRIADQLRASTSRTTSPPSSLTSPPDLLWIATDCQASTSVHRYPPAARHFDFRAPYHILRTWHPIVTAHDLTHLTAAAVRDKRQWRPRVPPSTTDNATPLPPQELPLLKVIHSIDV